MGPALSAGRRRFGVTFLAVCRHHLNRRDFAQITAGSGTGDLRLVPGVGLRPPGSSTTDSTTLRAAVNVGIDTAQGTDHQRSPG